jgi:hypothetical protein
MLACSISALAAYRASISVQWSILVGVMGVYLLAIIGIHSVEKRYAIRQASKISS